MEPAPLVSALILNWNGKDIIGPCVDSVLDNSYANVEAIVVDNISTDGSIELLNERFGNDKRVRIIVSETNLAPAAAMDIGIKNSLGEYILILNNDNRVDKDCIRNLISAMVGDINLCSPKIMLPSGKMDFSGCLMDRWGYGYGRGYLEENRQQYNDQDFFYAGFFMFKKSLVEKTGFFDKDICFGWEDVDFSWRVRLSGNKIVLVPTAIVYHLGSHTLKRLRTKYFCHYNMRKNRVAGLIKNYGLCNLTRFLPTLLFFYSLVFLKELIFDRDVHLAFTSVSAVWWNIKKLPLLLKKRRVVQKYIRSVSDREILKYMTKKSILIEYFLKPNFRAILKN